MKHGMLAKVLALTIAICWIPLLGLCSDFSAGTPRKNAQVFQKLGKGINIDTAHPDAGVWPKIQHDSAHFQAAAEAAFDSVRVMMPFHAHHRSTEQQIKDALSNNLAIVVCMWGSKTWPGNPKLGEQQIADKWRELAEAWKDFPSDLVFEILNEPEGLGFKDASGAEHVMSLYNAAVQAIRDVDPDRPILIGAPGFNDSEFLHPYVTDKYLSYHFENGKGFYEDTNTGVAIHFYSPKHKDGVNFAMWTQTLEGKDWKSPILTEITNAAKWRDRIGVDIPIITTEWGCWQFPQRSNRELSAWLDYHISNFRQYDLGNMWYTGIQSNQRSFAIFDSELGWNQTVLEKLTGAKPTVLPGVSQIINGEFHTPDHAWHLTSDRIEREYVQGKDVYSGSSMLKLTVPDDASGQLYLQTYQDRNEYMGAPGRTLLHVLKGKTYEISFIAASENGVGRVKLMLRNALTGDKLYDSHQADNEWIDVGEEPLTYTRIYHHNKDTVMDVRLELDVGSKRQILYLDKFEFIRISSSN